MKGWKVFAEINELKRKGLNKSQVQRTMKVKRVDSLRAKGSDPWENM